MRIRRCYDRRGCVDIVLLPVARGYNVGFGCSLSEARRLTVWKQINEKRYRQGHDSKD